MTGGTSHAPAAYSCLTKPGDHPETVTNGADASSKWTLAASADAMAAFLQGAMTMTV
jgi:hypothetical protein